MNQTTITSKTTALKEFFKTENVIYQSGNIWFVHMTVNGVDMQEALKVTNNLGLKISMVRANAHAKLSLFLESA